jgi:hypothetical protein
MYIKNRLASSPEAAGKSFISFICCNFWLLKKCAGKIVANYFLLLSTALEPLLSTAQAIQNIVYGAQECVASARAKLQWNLQCEIGPRLDEGRYEDEKKPKVPGCFLIARLFHYFSLISSVGLVFVCIYAAFTL